MAKSLKCGECGALFLSVQEAQTHGELSKHTRFEETTEKVQVWFCAACGKPARSDADRKLHSRHTGHDEWRREEDGAAALGGGKGGGALDTEGQMAAAKADAQAEAEADAELLGLKRKQTNKKGEQGGGGGGRGGGGGGGGGGGEGAGGKAGPSSAADAADANDDDLVPISVDAAALAELVAMGFGEARAARALHATGNAGVEAAVGWLAEREGDDAKADDGQSLDAPLLVPRREAARRTGGAASALSPEEARAKAAEMMARAKERREREERELAARRERDRIRAGKELQAALRLEEDGKLKRAADERRREKAEEERARQALRAKLDEDRKARRRRLGLPEEPTEGERAAEAERRRRAQEAADAERAAHGPPPATAAALAARQRDALRALLVAMKKGAPEGEAQFRTCAATLAAYVRNLGASSPGSDEERRFRRVNRGNAAFQARVACLPEGEAFLAAIGFERSGGGGGGGGEGGGGGGGGGGGEGGGDFLEVPAGTEVDRARLGVAAAVLDDALTNAFFGVL